MQGTLSEIDIGSLLQLLEIGQRTGQLYVEATAESELRNGDLGQAISDRPASWFVFFTGGRITYATGRKPNSLERLRDYLSRYRAEGQLKGLMDERPAALATTEYVALWQLIERHTLSPAQGRSILHNLIGESLFELLSLHQGVFVVESAPAIAPQLGKLEVAPLVAKTLTQVQKWWQFHPHLRDPTQCPVLVDTESLKGAMSAASYQSLTRACNGTTTLRQWSRYLNRDLIEIARAIYPYVQRGWVQLRDCPSARRPTMPTAKSRGSGRNSTGAPHIFCIDDDLTICRSIEHMLKARDLAVTTALDPIAALPMLFQVMPDVIFCDISMPELEGYEVCAMLRAAQLFRQTPIIMLTGKEGFIDRARARMVGATDYLTKPFGEQELFVLIEKYLGIPCLT